MLPKEEFSVREIKPNIVGLRNSTRPSLVEVQHFLYVRVVGAKNLPLNPATWSCDPYVELTIGNYRGKTSQLLNNLNPMWNEVFCFRKEHLQSKTLEISVKDGTTVSEIGTLSISIGDAPISLPGDGSLAPQNYLLQKKNGSNHGYGDLMIALWIGNQTDDEYPNASLAHASSVSHDKIEYVRAKTYQQPRLWYLRVKLIDAVDLVPLDPNQVSEVSVWARLGKKLLKTKVSESVNPSWNEELIFVAAEPFDDTLVLSVVDEKKKHVFGFYEIPLHEIDKRLVAGAHSDARVDLKPHTLSREVKLVRFASKLHLNLYLDGVYHVFHEPAQFRSDLTATSPKMTPASIGKLHLGIAKAVGLAPMKTENGIQTINNAYCVAKYGYKWIRTSTIVGSLEPEWNEEYEWDVYDSCTVITIGVFHNSNLQAGRGSMDLMIGMVSIPLSTLKSGGTYTLAYPLLDVNRDGLKKRGEIHLNVRFDCSNMCNLLSTYGLPLLPKAHHTHPLSVYQLNTLRRDAVTLSCLKFGGSEPALRREVVECMLSAHPRVWSIRRARANCQRVMRFSSYFSTAWEWYDDIREWRDPVRTVTVWFLFSIVLIIPWLILPMLFVYLLWTIIWNYWKQPKHPPFFDMKLSQIETTTLEDWDEEFDTFESSAQGEFLRKRYDRLRRIGEGITESIGDLANQLERVECVTSWRDPRATFLFALFCVFAATVTYYIPFKWLLFWFVTYMLRFPKLRVTLPPIPQNFLRRLPSKQNCML